MPYATNPVDDVRIYYESVGTGPPLALAHGLFRSTVDWYEHGFIQAFEKKHNVISVDSRAHGLSDNPHDPSSYSVKLLVGDFICVLDELSIPKAHFFGNSLGGRVGYGFLKYRPERLLSMSICGANVETRQSAAIDEISNWLGGGILNTITELERIDGKPRPEPWRKRLMSFDPVALQALVMSELFESGVDAGLEQISVPSLFYSGTGDSQHDGIKRTAARVPGSEFHSLAGLSHSEAGDRIDLVFPMISDFISKHSGAGE